MLGSLLPLRRNALEFFTSLLRERGDRVRLKILGRSILLLCHPHDIEQVLVRDRDAYGRAAEIRKLRPIFGNGLLASEGDLWHLQRTLIQPNFQPDALARYSSIMLRVIDTQTRAWHAAETRDIHAEMMKYTRDTILRVLFGPGFGGQGDVAEAVSTVFGDLRSEILYLPIWRWLPTPRARRWNRAVRLLNRTIATTIATRQGSGEQNDLLGALLRARDPSGEAMTVGQIHDEILTFFLAGHETAALSLTWAAYLLALHPDAQQRASDEVRRVTQQRELAPGDYSALPWTTAVVKEAIRLYPPVWSMGRQALADTRIDGQPITRGTDIWICLHRLHRDPRWFEKPDCFLPERWLRGHATTPFSYLPFGLGPRVCIGQRFALAESVFGLATMLSRFRLALAGERPALSAWVTLRPTKPILLRLE